MEDILYLAAAICFIFAIKGLSSTESALRGNIFGVAGMFLACIAACTVIDISNLSFIISAVLVGGVIGIAIAQTISMTILPQMIAGFHSLVGLAAVFVAFAVYFVTNAESAIAPYGCSKLRFLEMGIGAAIGAITFSGSIVAFLKFYGVGRKYRIHPALNAFLGSSIACLLTYFMSSGNENTFVLLTVCSFIVGVTLIAPIGGADMPIVVSLLNSCSGWATSGIGFSLHNDLLIIVGALVGASGAILSYIMCKSMNRSLRAVIFTLESERSVSQQATKTKAFRQGAPEDAAYILKNANSVIVVPGYGMATSQAQHVLKEMGDILTTAGIRVRYAIHPVAGRIPGHMNVLLAEANVSYDEVFELNEINRDFSSCDVAYVIGANDVTNPAARKDSSSLIYGMPILEVEKAKVILFLKRSMGVGYAGVDNELFYAQNTMMLLGDAKKTTEAIVKAM
ncbi:MAG: NAD(P)(+) transhydrogenase (Re/Si-specific) subunit beta [Holosporaceae bacterium]|jgi:NAD(P) transhydrogenase subunit beta|nr:NAD(P)(+) transhydrogenase (Re/Si-specific) subunit beta [Holosporaceae bacterium]